MTQAPNLELHNSLPILAEEQIEQYHRDGHLVVRQLLAPAEVAASQPFLVAAANREAQKLNAHDYPASAASGSTLAYDLRKTQPSVWQFITSPRLTQAAAELLDSDRIRILHYNCFFKPAQGHRTPWHRDCFYIPLEPGKSIVAWVPLVNLTPEMGPLAFGTGSHRIVTADLLDASQYSQDCVEQMLLKQGLRLTSVGSMAVGDVSFHHSLTLHGAPVNQTNIRRDVVAISYYADDARIQEPENREFLPPHVLQRSVKYCQSYLQEYFPHLQLGDLAHSPHNPIVYQRIEQEAKWKSR